MKKILILLIAAGLTVSASAQKSYYRGGSYHANPRIIVSTGFYSPFFPYYGYYGYPYFGYTERPTRLDLKIEDIQNDYKKKIQAARHDKSIPRKERMENVRLLKHERDQAVIQAKRDYYKPAVAKR
jgi:hypothetical protein